MVDPVEVEEVVSILPLNLVMILINVINSCDSDSDSV